MKVVDINGKLKEKTKKEFVAYFMEDFVSELPLEMQKQIAVIAKEDFGKFEQSVYSFYLEFKTGLVMEEVR